MNSRIHSATRKHGTGGYTFTELLIAMGALVIVASAVYAILGATLNLYVSGISTTRTGYSMRQVYDRMAMDIMQSPGQYAAAMDVTTGTPPTVTETVSAAGGALGLVKVVAGPLEMSNFTGTDTPFTSAQLRIPIQEPGTTSDSLAKMRDNEIKVNDYIKLIIGDSREARITAVVATASGWTVTCEPYTITFAANPTSVGTDVTPAVFILRYAAYVVLPNRPHFANRTNNLLVYYEGLRVNARRNGSDLMAPSSLRLPNNYLTNYDRLVSTDLKVHGQVGNLKPFTVVGESVLINLGLQASEYDKIDTTPKFFTTSDLNATVHLKSKDL